MAETLRQVIKKITRFHLEKGNSLFGQCLTAVGNVQDTIDPTSPNLVELQMSDIQNGAVTIGASLFSRPIYVIRYSGFVFLNLPFIVNYAAKSKEIWGIPCPIFIRAIAMEGGGGPVASNSHHSYAYRMPGIKIVSPMTPDEYKEIYNSFILDDCPYFVSEHRGIYDNDKELKDIEHENPDFCLFPISITRFAAIEAAEELKKEGLKINIYHQLWIKPSAISKHHIEILKTSKFGGAILDDDYPMMGQAISADLMIKSGKPVYTLALRERSAGFAPHLDNLPPQKQEIIDFIREKAYNK